MLAMKEIVHFQDLKHENIVRYCRHWTEEVEALCLSTFQDEIEPYFYIQMEYGSQGSLAEFIQSGRKIELGFIATVLKDLLHGLNYIHQKELVHRDMKPV